jgi:hypothetical protein
MADRIICCNGARLGSRKVPQSPQYFLLSGYPLRNSGISNLYTQDDRDEKQAAQGAFLTAVGLGSRLVQ